MNTKQFMMDSIISAFNNADYTRVESLFNDFEGCFSPAELAAYMDSLDYNLNEFVLIANHADWFEF